MNLTHLHKANINKLCILVFFHNIKCEGNELSNVCCFIDWPIKFASLNNNCYNFFFNITAPSLLRIEPVGRWYEAYVRRQQHGFRSHHSSSGSSSSSASEGSLSSDEEDEDFLLSLDPSEWKVWDNLQIKNKKKLLKANFILMKKSLI